ncbi:MAG: hypothetical protein EOM69_11350, partial [Clostridia bacterium]|nr:hypothetical protein [Clostridia bacterium]
MRLQESVMRLLLTQPFYGSLASSVSLCESARADKMKMTLLPSPVLTYNREWFESLSDAQTVGALLHELLHLLLLHALRRGGRDALLWAVCCDMAVNDQLAPEMLTKDAVTTEKIEKESRLKLERGRSAEYYYGRLSDSGGEFSLLLREDSVTLYCSDGSALEAKLCHEENVSQMDERALKRTLDELIEQA